MGLFSSKVKEGAFKTQLIEYFIVKNELEIVDILRNCILKFNWYSHDNWDGGVNIYILHIETPINVFAKYEEKIPDIAIRINKCSNILLKGNNQVGATEISIQQGSVGKHQKQGLLMAIERAKAILIARATGKVCDNDEYQVHRSVLLNNTDLRKILPTFITYYANLDEFWSYIKPKYPRYALRREHIVGEFKSLIDHVQNSKQNPIHNKTEEVLEKINSDSVHKLWKKSVDRLQNNDLDGAITAANSLLENTIKSILNSLAIDYSDEKDDIPKLYKLLSKKLNLSPGQHLEEIFKQILGGCASVVLGLGSIRNKISDAHVPGKKPARPAFRHAELAVNLAGTMATFLISTWENKSIQKEPVEINN